MEKEKEHKDKSMVELTKIIGELWKNATEDDKKLLLKVQEEDQKRYDKEMKQFNELGYFINSDGVKSTFLNRKGKAQEFEAGTVMPKKVMGAYFHFALENRPKLWKENPEKKMTEIASMAGKIWMNMSE